MKSFFSRHGTNFIFTGAAFAAFALMLVLRFPCPIKHLTGLSCAGCGMTRACLSALSLDFSAAFAYHPLWVILLPLAVSVIIFSAKGYKRTLNAVLISAAVLFFGAWLFRLALGDDVVAFDFDNSAIGRIIAKMTDAARGCDVRATRPDTLAAF